MTVVLQVYPGGSEALHERGELWLHGGGSQAAAGAGEGSGPGGGGGLPRAVLQQHAETHPLPRAQDPVILWSDQLLQVHFRELIYIEDV